jgi:hypothetical protein
VLATPAWLSFRAKEGWGRRERGDMMNPLLASLALLALGTGVGEEMEIYKRDEGGYMLWFVVFACSPGIVIGFLRKGKIKPLQQLSLFKMFLNCFASCTRCLTARREKRSADPGERTPIVPDTAVPGQATLGAVQVPGAIDTHNSSEPPFQADICFCNGMGKPETLPVNVDLGMPVNVITNKRLAALGFEPRQHSMPSELSDLAAQMFPGFYGWQKLGLYAPEGGSGPTSDPNFIVVGDDYHCDVLLGCEFNQLTRRPGPGIYPNFIITSGKGPACKQPSFYVERFDKKGRSIAC